MDSLENDVSNAFSSLVSTAAPAAIAGAENYAAEQLQKSANAATQQATVAAAKAPPATGIMASIENAFGNVAIGSWVEQNKTAIIIGSVVVGVILFSYYQKR